MLMAVLLGSVLAARIRIPNHIDAIHTRHRLRHHYPEERCAPWPISLHIHSCCIAGLLTDAGAAKYLDQIKGGRVPVEVLVRGKDAAENEKHFIKIAEIIKNAGVSHACWSVVVRWGRLAGQV